MPSDFGSRNALPCCLEICGICAFIKVSQDATVLKTYINDVISGASRLPFASRRSWYDIQSSCPDLRRTHAHLKQGTRPSKKITNAADVKRYLRVATIAGDGLLVVPQQEVLSGSRECIIVPRQILNGLVMALHLQLDHPSAHQLQKVMRRSFFALDLDRCIKTTTELCHQCAALRQIPKTVVEQSTGYPPAAVGVTFSADVIRRNRQIIIVLRESVTSYTLACFIDNEQHPTLREAIIKLTKSFTPLAGPPAVICTDPGTGFCALTNDDLLSHHRVHVEIGRHKNTNKNPEAERAVQELEAEILKQDPLGGAITDLTLTLAVSRLNKRIRGRGLSSWEMWTHRDMYHNTETPVSDLHLIESQHQSRSKNHPISQKSKNPFAKPAVMADLAVGDLVYISGDLDKNRARDRYLVVAIDGPWCDIRRLSGAQLRTKSYRVKRSECFKIQSEVEMAHIPDPDGDQDTYSSTPNEHVTPGTVPGTEAPVMEVAVPRPPPAPPDIPLALSLPDTPARLVPDVDNSCAQASPPEPVPSELPFSPLMETPSSPGADQPTLRRSHRLPKPNTRLKDYVTNFTDS